MSVTKREKYTEGGFEDMGQIIIQILLVFYFSMLEVLRVGFFTYIFCTNTVDNGESERHIWNKGQGGKSILYK